jgi:hypothetical protein
MLVHITYIGAAAAAAIGHAAFVCVDGLGEREERAIDTHPSSAMYGTLSPASHTSQGFSPGRWLRGERRDGGCPQRWEKRQCSRDTEVAAYSGRKPSAVESPCYIRLCCARAVL